MPPARVRIRWHSWCRVTVEGLFSRWGKPCCWRSWRAPLVRSPAAGGLTAGMAGALVRACARGFWCPGVPRRLLLTVCLRPCGRSWHGRASNGSLLPRSSRRRPFYLLPSHAAGLCRAAGEGCPVSSPTAAAVYVCGRCGPYLDVPVPGRRGLPPLRRSVPPVRIHPGDGRQMPRRRGSSVPLRWPALLRIPVRAALSLPGHPGPGPRQE